MTLIRYDGNKRFGDGTKKLTLLNVSGQYQTVAYGRKMDASPSEITRFSNLFVLTTVSPSDPDLPDADPYVEIIVTPPSTGGGGGGFTAEEIRDQMAGLLRPVGLITITPDDALDKIEFGTTATQNFSNAYLLDLANATGNLAMEKVLGLIDALNNTGSASTPLANTTPPTLVGGPLLSTPFVMSSGGWNGVGVTYAYQWYESDTATGTKTAIAGQTTNTLDPAAALARVGKYITGRVTATDSATPTPASLQLFTTTRIIRALPIVTLTASYNSDGQPILTYAVASGTTSDIQEVDIFRTATATGTIGSTPNGTLAPPNNGFVDVDATPGTTFYYRARPSGINGDGLLSVAVPATPTATAVTHMGVSSVNGAAVNTDFNVAVNIPTGCDTLISPVGFGVPSNNVDTDQSFTTATVKLDGVALTLIPGASIQSDGQVTKNRGGRIYYLKNPKVGPGTLTFSFKATGPGGQILGWGEYLKGVNNAIVASTPFTNKTGVGATSNGYTFSSTSVIGNMQMSFLFARSTDSAFTSTSANATISQFGKQGTNLIAGSIRAPASGGTDALQAGWTLNGSGAAAGDMGSVIGITVLSGANSATTPPVIVGSGSATTAEIQSFIYSQSRVTSVKGAFDLPDVNLGYTSGDWYVRTTAREPYPPSDFAACVPWGWIINHGNGSTEDNTNHASGVWIWDFKAWFYILNQGWTTAYTSTGAFGGEYETDNGALGSQSADYTKGTNLAGAPTTGYTMRVQNIDTKFAFHFFHNNRYGFAVNTLRGSITQFRAMLIQPYIGNGAEPKYVANAGRDFWRATSGGSGNTYSDHHDGGIGGPRRVTNYPRLFAFYNGDDQYLTNLPTDFTADKNELSLSVSSTTTP